MPSRVLVAGARDQPEFRRPGPRIWIEVNLPQERPDNREESADLV